MNRDIYLILVVVLAAIVMVSCGDDAELTKIEDATIDDCIFILNAMSDVVDSHVEVVGDGIEITLITNSIGKEKSIEVGEIAANNVGGKIDADLKLSNNENVPYGKIFEEYGLTILIGENNEEAVVTGLRSATSNPKTTISW